MHYLLACLLACLLVCLSLLAGSAHANDLYVVNTFDVDLPQANMDLANCDANPGLAGDQCTLRAAIMLANKSQQPATIVLPVNTTIVLNLPGNGGAEVGDLDITSPMIITGAFWGPPADLQTLPLIQSSTGQRIFDVVANVNVTFHGLRLSGGTASLVGEQLGGGAIRIANAAAHVMVDTVRFSNNFSPYGGAISNVGTLEIINSDFVNNEASTFGSHLHVRPLGITTVRNSSFRFSVHSGLTKEAIAVAEDGRLVLENSMIDGQPLIIGGTATSGIRADRPSVLWIRNSTLSGFTQLGLDLILDNSASIQIFNTIVAGSGQQDCTISASTTTSGTAPVLRIDDSLIQSFDCFGDGPLFGVHIGDNVQIGVNPLLPPMTSQPGSLVFARPIAFGSPAVDSGFDPLTSGGAVPAARPCLSHDIRNQPRPQDGNADGEARCDMGAVEASTLQSSIFIVNASDDAVDANPGDGVCETAAGNGQCSLRAAVMEANAKPGPDVIRFASPIPTIQLTIPGFGGAHQGDLDITEQLVIEGNLVNGRPDTAISASALSQRIFDAESLPPGHTLTLRNLSLSGGSPFGPGGAVRAVNVSRVEIERVAFNSNEATTQGGAVSVTGGDLVIRDSAFRWNTSPEAGAAVYFGGGGTALIDRSSFWENQSADGMTPSVLHFDGAASARLYTSTLHGNSGGIAAFNSASVDIRASTIVDNTVFGLRVIDGGAGTQLALRSSILAGNALNDCTVGGLAISGGYNLIGDGSCSPASSNNLSGDPGLAPALTILDNEIGRFRLPLTGSPVIDAVPATGVGGSVRCLALDQRHRPRPIDSTGDGVAACEIGAVELTQVEAGPREFVVNMTDDAVDMVPGDGRCNTSPNPGDQCSLRAAIMEANALPGPDSISIPLPGQTLSLTIPSGGGPGHLADHGDLDIHEALTITGILGDAAQRPLIDASHGDRIFDIYSDNVSLRGLRLTGGVTEHHGGAVQATDTTGLLIEEVDMSYNTGVAGGGALALHHVNAATLVRTDLRFNTTAGDGGAVKTDAGSTTIFESSVRGNVDASPEGQREAIHVSGGSVLVLVNSTVSGNQGDGVDVVDGSLRTHNATIVHNSGSGIDFERVDGEVLDLRNTVLAYNAQSGCTAAGPGAVSISTNGFNLSQGNGCDIESGASNIIDPDPLLGPLQISSAEFSAYHVPLTGSPLIDSGSDGASPECMENDQIGTPRPVDGNGDGDARCDIGAVEVGPLTDALFADGFED